MIEQVASGAGANEWEAPGEPEPRAAARATVGVALLLPPAVLVVLALAFGGALAWGAVAGVCVAELAWVLVQPRVLRAGARRADEETDARALNIVRGLARDAGRKPPQLFVSPRAGANAAVLPSSGGAIVVTEEMLEGYGRTELEAVIAHCLVRLRTGGLGWALASAAFGGLGAGGAPFVGTHLDARAAAITRYPPALASAIEKAAVARGAAASLWFVATGPSHLPPDDRAAALRDL